MVYILTNATHTTKYDIDKNNWIQLHEEMRGEKMCNNAILWMVHNPFILCSYV